MEHITNPRSRERSRRRLCTVYHAVKTRLNRIVENASAIDGPVAAAGLTCVWSLLPVVELLVLFVVADDVDGLELLEADFDELEAVLDGVELALALALALAEDEGAAEEPLAALLFWTLSAATTLDPVTAPTGPSAFW